MTIEERGAEDERLAGVHDRALLTAALAGLDKRKRQLIFMHHLQDISVADIAAELDLPVGTVKVTLMRAKATLRQSLDDDARMR